MKGTPTCTKIIIRFYNASTKLLLHQPYVNHLKMAIILSDVQIFSVCHCVHWCCVCVIVDILCCCKELLRYSPCFCTCSFVNSCTTSCIVGIHFPFKVAAERSCKLPHSQVISLHSMLSPATKPVRQQIQWTDSSFILVHNRTFKTVCIYIIQNIQKGQNIF